MPERAGEGAGELGDAVAALVARLGTRAKLDEPLGALTTYRVGGAAAVMVDVRSADDLLALADALESSGAAGRIPVLVLGKGSNLLVADRGFTGLVVRPGGALADMEVRQVREVNEVSEVSDSGVTGGGAVVRAGGALGMPVLARRTVDAGLRGLEWAVGIPGSVGGALKMNAGGHGSDTASCLVRYRSVDLAGNGGGESDASRLALGYRTSDLSDGEVVVWADLAVRHGDPAQGKAVIAEIVRWRREHQPGGSNAGSVFTNPPGDSAGRLVESVGLKGFRLGTAGVSEKHANFIQADEGGSAQDVVALMRHVRRTVASATGVLLRPEVKLAGFGPEPFGAEPFGAEPFGAEPSAAEPGR